MDSEINNDVSTTWNICQIMLRLHRWIWWWFVVSVPQVWSRPFWGTSDLLGWAEPPKCTAFVCSGWRAGLGDFVFSKSWVESGRLLISRNASSGQNGGRILRWFRGPRRSPVGTSLDVIEFGNKCSFWNEIWVFNYLFIWVFINGWNAHNGKFKQFLEMLKLFCFFENRNLYHFFELATFL